MEFNELVTEKIVPLFKRYGFQVTEEYKNFFQFKSALVEAIISYNELDKTSLFEIGRRDNFLYPITDNAIRQVFGLNVKIIQQTKEAFVNSIVIFLEKEGTVILSGDLSRLNNLKLFVEEESDIYTSQILEQQNLVAVNKAWDIGNYREFIELINQINKDKLPSSYKLKYKIANQRV